MAHIAYVIESSLIDISQREHQIVRVWRELHHPKAVRRMDVSYRVNAKLLRFHASRIQHPLNGRGTPEIFTESASGPLRSILVEQIASARVSCGGNSSCDQSCIVLAFPVPVFAAGRVCLISRLERLTASLLRECSF